MQFEIDNTILAAIIAGVFAVIAAIIQGLNNPKRSIQVGGIVLLITGLLTFLALSLLSSTPEDDDGSGPIVQMTEEVGLGPSETPTSTREATPTATMPPNNNPGTTPPPNGDCSFTAEDQITVAEVGNGHDYRFLANPGDIITLLVTGIGDPADPRFFLFDPSGAEITRNNTSGNPERLDSYILSATGQYRLNIRSGGNRPMTYVLELNCTPNPTPPDTTFPTESLFNCDDSLDARFSTEIDVRQRSEGHTVTFDAHAGDIITLVITGIGDPADPRFFLLDPSRTEITRNNTSGNPERLDSYILSATGQYTLNIRSGGNRPMAYTLQLDCDPTDVRYPSPPLQSVLNCGDSLNAEISVGERNEGHTYTFNTSESGTLTLIASVDGVGNSADPRIFLYDSSGSEVTRNNTSGNSERLEANIEATGEYRLNITSVNRPMAYNVTLECLSN